MAPLPDAKSPGRSIRTAVDDFADGFMRATKPPARADAGKGANAFQRLVPIVVRVNMYVAAGVGIAMLYTLPKARTGITTGAFAASLALLAVLMVVAKMAWRIVLVPLHHVALAIVAAAVAIEVLLAGRVFVQLAYDENVQGYGGDLLSLTDPLVEPFKGLEGTAILHDTGVVEFATLTAMEAVLVGSLVTVVLLMFWSEFLHMYRRIRDFLIERAERRRARKEAAAEAAVATAANPSPLPDLSTAAANPAPLPDMSTAAADLSAAS